MHPLAATFKAWLRCKPRGVCLPKEQAKEIFPVLKDLLRENKADSEGLALLPLFEPQVEQVLFKPGVEYVEFLSFWRVVAVVWHACGGEHGTSFTDELETFRDEILRTLDERGGSITGDQLKALAVSAGELSLQDAALWQDFVDALPPLDNLTAVECAVVLLPFLQDASDRAGRAPSGPELDILPPNMVQLHVYDVSKDEKIGSINRWLAPRSSPLKFGGVFHAGVEVYGLEWAYGMTFSETQPGVHCTMPKTHQMHTYRQSVNLGPTPLSAEEVAELISELAEEWPGTEYDLLHRNCCTFADTFAKALQTRRVPRWVHRLARVGATVDTAYTGVTNAWAKLNEWMPGSQPEPATWRPEAGGTWGLNSVEAPAPRK